MNRREFVKHLALLAAGAAALPSQVAAFERLYEANTSGPLATSTSLLSVNDIVIGFGGTPRDAAAVVRFFNGESAPLAFPLNTRATIRWIPAPDCPFLTSRDRFRWSVDDVYGRWTREEIAATLTGSIRYTDMDGVIQNAAIDGRTWKL